MQYSLGTNLSSLSLEVGPLNNYYRNGGSPAELFNFIYDRIDEDNKTFSSVWIHLQSRKEVLESIKHLQGLNPHDLPLYGIPFSVKDNINVEIVEVISKNELKVKFWERGAGITLSCGSGILAAFYASHTEKKCSSSVKVLLPIGSVDVNIKNKDITFSGVPEVSFLGEFSYE